MNTPVGMAVIGAGYWGPNLVRNAMNNADINLRWVVDLDHGRATSLAAPYSGVTATNTVSDVFDDPTVEAVAIATPASSHAELAIAAMNAGKHVVIEKPIASSVMEARRMLDVSAATGCVLMCDHTYCYTPAVAYIRAAIANGDLGDLQFVDSVRINLGRVQHDVDVVWDLAPHDLSILDAILPAGDEVISVSATGADPVGAGQACVAYLSMELASGAIAHVHVNWLSPTKVRTMIVGGSRRTLVWDDIDPTQRISVFDRGVDISGIDPSSTVDTGIDTTIDTTIDEVQRRIAYRIGDMVAPALPEREALASMFDEFVASIRDGRAALTDGHAGLRVLRLLEAARLSMSVGGEPVPVERSGRWTVPTVAPAPALPDPAALDAATLDEVLA
jgi:predicted dehydrogenase